MNHFEMRLEAARLAIGMNGDFSTNAQKIFGFLSGSNELAKYVESAGYDKPDIFPRGVKAVSTYTV